VIFRNVGVEYSERTDHLAAHIRQQRILYFVGIAEPLQNVVRVSPLKFLFERDEVSAPAIENSSLKFTAAEPSIGSFAVRALRGTYARTSPSAFGCRTSVWSQRGSFGVRDIYGCEALGPALVWSISVLDHEAGSVSGIAAKCRWLESRALSARARARDAR
jgi:hypothetical protein